MDWGFIEEFFESFVDQTQFHRTAVLRAGGLGFDCRTGGNNSQCSLMANTIRWPDGEFTIQAAVDLNAAVPQAEIRKKLADGLTAKSIVQTQKGDGKIKGKFQAVK
jgi:hypothetical protein